MPTLGDIAKALDLPFCGNPETPLSRLASLDSAGEGDLSFVAQKKFSNQLATSLVTAVICPEEWVGDYTGGVLLSAQPYIDFARATRLFDNRPQPSGCVHETAIVATTAQLGANVTIDAGAVLEDGVVVGDNVWIGPNVWVGSDVKIGDATEIRSGVILYHGVTIGRGCLIHANTVIGSDGFGFAPTSSGWEKILQLGSVSIGDRVEIGAGCAIDRGALDNTVI
ncbi:MAG: UDP-3-O-(3-hydroxymyristoyl)glucosamine N-acyltransferase, partial [Pseudomonadota bacterium]|nr:UDP-3-O-(3-hydroxymyristoyl)glucosamine N-acyltransferase [Pseudomonadota bacterium]